MLIHCRIVEIQKLIDETLATVQAGRKDLDIARHHFTTASLGIVANYRKRTVVLEVLRSINNIKTLVSSKVYCAHKICNCTVLLIVLRPALSLKTDVLLSVMVSHGS